MEEGPLTRESRHAVLSNEIPAIRIRNFANDDECRAFSAAVEAVGYKFYSVARKIGYIGLAQYEYRWERPKTDYFRDAEAAYGQQQIGRASCRARVCQYVSISVVAASLKTKKKQTTHT